jgi:uncharacterized protein
MLYDQIQSDLKTAMLAKDEQRVSTLRMLISAIRYTGNGRDDSFTDEEVLSVIQKEVKKRKEASVAFKSGGRDDQSQKEDQEAELLSTYLPTQLSDEELVSIVESVIQETGASGITEMGKVIGGVMGKTKGQADGGRVSALVKEKLSV